MNNFKNPLIAILTGLLVLSMPLFGQPAHAAACSKFDRQMWDGKSKDNILLFSRLATDNFVVEYVDLTLNKLDVWVATTKSKKVKAAVNKFMIEFELGAVYGDWRSNPKYAAAHKSLSTMFKLNRC
jgi:hypothetical protein